MQTPDAIADLPKDQRGYPIPFFVYRPEDGAEPDLRIADVRTQRLCHLKRLCWVCGRKLGETLAFIGGPKSVQQHVFVDYAMHLECAEFSMRTCPFLLGQSKRYAKAQRPSQAHAPAGMILERPEIMAIYLTRKYRTVEVGQDVLFRPGKAVAVKWFRDGQRIERPGAL